MPTTSVTAAPFTERVRRHAALLACFYRNFSLALRRKNPKHRLALATFNQRSTHGANPATRQFLLITMLTSCAIERFFMQWGSNSVFSHRQSHQANPHCPPNDKCAGPLVTSFFRIFRSYNPVPWRMMRLVSEQGRAGVRLGGGSVLGGMVLLPAATQHLWHIPKRRDPLRMRQGTKRGTTTDGEGIKIALDGTPL